MTENISVARTTSVLKPNSILRGVFAQLLTDHLHLKNNVEGLLAERGVLPAGLGNESLQDYSDDTTLALEGFRQEVTLIPR